LLQNDNLCITDRNSNDKLHASIKLDFINRILTQNDKIVEQNASILSFLTSSTEEKKQTKSLKSLDPTAPSFNLHDMNDSSTQPMPSQSQNPSSTPIKIKNGQLQPLPSVNSIIKTSAIIGDSLLKDLDSRQLSDSSYMTKIRTHQREDLKNLDEKVNTKYKTLLQSSDTVIICMVAVPFPLVARPLHQGGFEKIAEYNQQLKSLCGKRNVEFLRLNDFAQNSQGVVTYIQRHDLPHCLIATSREAM
ncbi:unnamed protein product, partial [Didymodactylos carnosus]